MGVGVCVVQEVPFGSPKVVKGQRFPAGYCTRGGGAVKGTRGGGILVIIGAVGGGRSSGGHHNGRLEGGHILG